MHYLVTVPTFEEGSDGHPTTVVDAQEQAVAAAKAAFNDKLVNLAEFGDRLGVRPGRPLVQKVRLGFGEGGPGDKGARSSSDREGGHNGFHDFTPTYGCTVRIDRLGRGLKPLPARCVNLEFFPR